MTTERTAPADRRDEVVDRRSVGELLLEADLASREMLWDPHAGSARAKARTWGEVVEAAAELWAAMPDGDHDSTMSRIHQMADSLHRTQVRTGWPGPGEPDPCLERITNTLARAAELIAGRRHLTAPLGGAGQLDSDAARTRLMHVLYVSAHGVGVALRGHAADLRLKLNRRQRLPVGESVKDTCGTLERLSAMERLGGSYLHSRWPTALTGQHRDPVEPARLERALARWDLLAHRSLAAPSTATTLLFSASVQRDLAVGTSIITAAAARVGAIGPEQQASRLAPALASLDHAWADLQADLQRLNSRARRLDPELLLAGNEARAALREITHDRTGLATPSAMAASTDLEVATHNLQHALFPGVSLAYAMRDAIQDPELTVTARGAHALAQASAMPEGLGGWITAADLHHNRAVTPPAPVQQALCQRVDRIVAAGSSADCAAGAIGSREHLASPPLTTRGSQHPDGSGAQSDVRCINARAADSRVGYPAPPIIRR